MFSGYIGIYRRKKYVGGRSRGPGNRGACPGGAGLRKEDSPERSPRPSMKMVVQ